MVGSHWAEYTTEWLSARRSLLRIEYPILADSTRWAEYPADWLFTDNVDKLHGRTALCNGYLPLMVRYPAGGVSYGLGIHR